jgi:CRISPR system Cascade subunit CasD
MATLLLRLQGPMQSWGTRSNFDRRDTGLEPSKSGVIGLVAAALGIDREHDITDLAILRMGVRVDREGVLCCDYQTARGVINAEGRKPKNVQSWRYYLADAAFLVGLEGNKELLQKIHGALLDPVWPLFLGRKSYAPSPPVYLPDGLREEGLVEALARYPYLPSLLDPKVQPERTLRYVIEAREGRLVLDQPVGPFSQRRFGARYTVSRSARLGEVVDVP